MSRILIFLSADSAGVPILAEQVTDCGPLVDIERSPGCTLLPITDEDKKKEFPDCCPQFDCEEGTEIFYEGSPAKGAEEPLSLIHI